MKALGMKVVALLTVLQLSGLQAPLLAGAAIVETGDFIAAAGDRRLDEVRLLVAREDVRRAFLAFGVAPGDVEQRLDSLTEREIAALEAGMAEFPAGGDGALAVIGIVFLVLLILEVVGVTDIFKKV